MTIHLDSNSVLKPFDPTTRSAWQALNHSVAYSYLSLCPPKQVHNERILFPLMRKFRKTPPHWVYRWKRPEFVPSHLRLLIDDDKETFENNCLSVIHDRCLQDMLFLIENSPVLTGGYWEMFGVLDWMWFRAPLLAKAGNSFQNEKNILSFQLKSLLRQPGIELIPLPCSVANQTMFDFPPSKTSKKVNLQEKGCRAAKYVWDKCRELL